MRSPCNKKISSCRNVLRKLYFRQGKILAYFYVVTVGSLYLLISCFLLNPNIYWIYISISMNEKEKYDNSLLHFICFVPQRIVTFKSEEIQCQYNTSYNT